jgi:hypothetical protein
MSDHPTVASTPTESDTGELLSFGPADGAGLDVIDVAVRFRSRPLLPCDLEADQAGPPSEDKGQTPHFQAFDLVSKVLVCLVGGASRLPLRLTVKLEGPGAAALSPVAGSHEPELAL